MALLNDHPIPNLIHPSDSSKAQWKRNTTTSSSDIDDSFDLEQDTTTNRTPSPKHRPSDDILASTPLHPNSTFMSPMQRLNDLHIESSPVDVLEDVNEESEYDEFSFGNKTITHDTDSDIDEDKENINRKRIHVESPSMMILTPGYEETRSENISSFNINNFSSSSLDYSTPCPNQPRRKKLKLKETVTPSKRVLLDLSHAVKTSIDNLPKIEHQEEEEEYEENPQEFIDQMPISSSTPSTSRASTPPLAQQEQQQTDDSPAYQEYGQSINGYKFVQRKQQFNYETPVNKYSKLREAYNAQDYTPAQGKYEIIGEFPMSSAGIMDEENVHVGDKRINDPYLEDRSWDIIRQEYFTGNKLPILPPDFYDTTLTHDRLIRLINRDNLLKFYDLVKPLGIQLQELLKQERIKWHPDKWIGKLQTDEYGFDLEVVGHLCQCINELFETTL